MFQNFTPKNEEKKLPFFDDVSSSDGWEGHTTGKSVEKLQQEISQNLSLLGCILTGFRSGKFGDREGFQIHFAMKSDDGRLIPSRMDIACLPLNPRKRIQRSRHAVDPRIVGTQKMALYMTAKAIKGMYFLNVLSPAFIPFMSLMLDAQDRTLGSLWIQQGSLSPLLPPPSSKFKDVDVVDAEIR